MAGKRQSDRAAPPAWFSQSSSNAVTDFLEIETQTNCHPDALFASTPRSVSAAVCFCQLGRPAAAPRRSHHLHWPGSLPLSGPRTALSVNISLQTGAGESARRRYLRLGQRVASAGLVWHLWREEKKDVFSFDRDNILEECRTCEQLLSFI